MTISQNWIPGLLGPSPPPGSQNDLRTLESLFRADSLTDLRALQVLDDNEFLILSPEKGLAFDLYRFDSPDSSVADGYNVIESNNAGAHGRWRRLTGPEIRVDVFPGIDPTGATSSQVAVDSAYAAAVAQGGGVLKFGIGKYRFNLVVRHDNIVIVGCGVRDVNINTTIGFFPWDMAKPIIQVGNDTGLVNGFAIRDVAMFGTVNSVDCPGCIHFLGGSDSGSAWNIGAIGGLETIKFKAGVAFPSTLNKCESCDLWEGSSATIIGDDTRTGAGYCTANRILGCHINGANTTGYAVKLIRGNPLDFSDTYFDTNPDHSFYSLDGGSARFSIGNMDNGSTTLNGAVVEWTSSNNDLSISRYMMGNVRLTGSITWVDPVNGTRVRNLPANGLDFSFSEPELRKPYLVCPSRLTTVDDPYLPVINLDLDSGRLDVSKQGGGDPTLQFSGNNVNFRIKNANLNSWFIFDVPSSTNTAAQMVLWRGTTTSADCSLTIHPGDGTGNSQCQFSAKSSSYVCANAGNFGVGTRAPLSRLHVPGLVDLADNAAAIAFFGALPGSAGCVYRTGDLLKVVH